MDAEILLCDAGNTSLKLAFANRSGILDIYRLPAALAMSADSLGLMLRQLVSSAGLEMGSIKACVVCSVLPGLEGTFRGAGSRYFKCPVFFAPQDLQIPLLNRYSNPAEAGVDRLVAAYAARRHFLKAKSIVLADFGTIATFDCIKNNEWLGGLLFPGPVAAMAAMNQAAPALPKNFMSSFLDGGACEPQKDTRSAMREGIFHGFTALAEGLCLHLSESLPKPVLKIATGGFAMALAARKQIFDEVLPNLVLDGLAALYYEKTHGN